MTSHVVEVISGLTKLCQFVISISDKKPMTRSKQQEHAQTKRINGDSSLGLKSQINDRAVGANVKVHKQSHSQRFSMARTANLRGMLKSVPS